MLIKCSNISPLHLNRQFPLFQIDELNGTIQSYRATISEKDAKLNELEAKLENVAVDQREQELFKQITDYKEKNNVSKCPPDPN